VNSIQHNVDKVREAVYCAAEQCRRNPSDITIVAVSKTKPAASILEAYQCGLHCFGENRIQEAEEKIPAIQEKNISWHLVGHLQTNKVKKAVCLFDWFHSVDSAKLIQKLNIESKKIGKTTKILLQVNLAKEKTKSGALLEEFETLIHSVQESESLQCRGLMTIPPRVEHPEEARKYFQQLRQLAERCQKDFLPADTKLELSMGMSHDFQIAIAEGATMVRIGTAIFGERSSV